jgi:hypothetical protein
MLITQKQIETVLQRELKPAEVASLRFLTNEAQDLISAEVGTDFSVLDDVPRVVQDTAIRMIARSYSVPAALTGVQSQNTQAGTQGIQQTFVPEAIASSGVYLSRSDKAKLSLLKGSGTRIVKVRSVTGR